MLSTAHALKTANMETRLKIKLFKIPFFLGNFTFNLVLLIKGVIIFVAKLKMVSRDPLTGKLDDNEWDACGYSL